MSKMKTTDMRSIFDRYAQTRKLVAEDVTTPPSTQPPVDSNDELATALTNLTNVFGKMNDPKKSADAMQRIQKALADLQKKTSIPGAVAPVQQSTAGYMPAQPNSANKSV